MKIILLILLWCLIAAISAPLAILALLLILLATLICLPFWILAWLLRSFFGLFRRRPRPPERYCC